MQITEEQILKAVPHTNRKRLAEFVVTFNKWGEKFGITVLGAGAFSNTFDRLVRGYVVDYFGVRCKNSKLSKITANLADLYILTGVSILTVSKEKKG